MLGNSFAFFILVFMFEGFVLCVIYPWLLLVGPLLLIIGGVILIWNREKIRLRSQGWTATPSEYREMRAGKPELISLTSIYHGCGRHELHIPAEEEWRKVAPDWAADRRDEIFTRVARQSGVDSIRYPEDWMLGPLDGDPFMTPATVVVMGFVAVGIFVFFACKAAISLGIWS